MHDNTEANPWLVCYEPNPEARLRLFCFSYAGGGASTFYGWAKQLPLDIETIGIQMPGLETRIMETPITSVSSVVHELVPSIYRTLDRPFAFFGHSLGALISFELTRDLRDQYEVQPVHLFVSGNSAPQIPDSYPPIHDLPEAEFLEQLKHRYNGIPPEVLENAELLELLVRGLRGSIKMDESYHYKTGDPIDCGITAFGGLQDDTVNDEDIEAWCHQTNGAFTRHMIPGNHFFIHSEKEHFLRILSRELTGILLGVK
jgi:medium-chain acyl-[acyl-carrier-protein] hydrolase